MRLVTRGDLDGLTCAVLICAKEGIDDILLVHPQAIVEGEVEVRSTDVVANLPYVPGCAMWFDHHHHTANVAAPVDEFEGAFGAAPSAARLVYEYYGGREALPQFEELVRHTDRLDSADLTLDDVERPQGYIKLGFTIDSRSGLGAFESYFMTLLHLLMKGTPVEEILAHPEVKKRCELLERADTIFRHTLKTSSRVDGNVIVTDFRGLDHTPMGNRFMVYALYPQANVSVRLQWGPNKEYVMMTLGHSIFNRTCRTNVGDLAARYGGGGHPGAASVPLIDDPDIQIQMIVSELKANG